MPIHRHDSSANHVPLKIVENCEGFRVVSVCEALHASSHAASWILESLYLSSEISREMHSLRMCCWKEYRERGYGLVLEEKRTWGWVLFHSWLFRPRWAVILGLFLSVLKTHLMSWALQKQGYLCLNSLCLLLLSDKADFPTLMAFGDRFLTSVW